MIQKPLKPFEVDPKAFILMIESFAKSYPNYWWELQEIAKSKHISELIIPKTIIYIEKMPVLSTGKTDYISITKLGETYLKDKTIIELEQSTN